MKTLVRIAGLSVLVVLAVMLFECDKEDDNVTGPGESTYDVDAKGIPRFVTANHIQLSRIEQISKFRSAAGHDYSDDFEDCRSMKHYYFPYGGDPGQVHEPSWTTIQVFSPVSGTVSKIEEEWEGSQIRIRSTEYPAFSFILFHVSLIPSLKAGDQVLAGQLIGAHASDQTMSDIAVGVQTPGGWKLVSFFDVMTDSLFASYQERSISSRTEYIISKEARDSDPLSCSGETFAGSGTLANWVLLVE
jgi:hypothetical protein